MQHKINGANRPASNSIEEGAVAQNKLGTKWGGLPDTKISRENKMLFTLDTRGTYLQFNNNNNDGYLWRKLGAAGLA